MVETESDEILRDADKVDVAFLVVGDPFGYGHFIPVTCLASLNAICCM
jgi:diphthine synthase